MGFQQATADRWAQPVESVRPKQISDVDASLVKHLEKHLADEQQILGEYRRLAESDDEPVRYIARLILEDEERHHRVLGEMLNQVRSSAWSVEQEPHVPWVRKSHDARQLRKSVKRFRAIERHDLRQLRAFRRRLALLRRDSLNEVLVSALILDTRKHLLFLRRLERLARN
jgi:hypothetical protein